MLPSTVINVHCVRWPKTDTILIDGGQRSEPMTDTVLTG